MEIMLGDCLEKMKDIPAGSVDMILTDPPYGTTGFKWDTPLDLENLWTEIWRVCKPNAAVVIFGNQPFTSKFISSNFKDYRYNWIWEKHYGSGFVLSRKQPLRMCEDIMVFYKKLPYYDYRGEALPEPEHYKKKWKGNRKKETGERRYDASQPRHYEGWKEWTKTHHVKRNILKFKRDKNKFHPTQKPIDLLKFLIETYTQENETVLDFTMGSGSTGVACKETNRQFIGIELDEKYFNVAKERIEGDRK